MKIFLKTILSVAFAVSSAGVAASAWAVTQNGDLTVSANVVNTCSVQGSSLPFGNAQPQLLQQSGNVAVNCSSGTTYSVALDAGASPAASRVIRGPANSVANGVQQNLPVYERISNGQAGTPGDVVGVTLSY